MHRILKVFCTGVDQDRLAETLQVVARYEGFVIAEIAAEKIADLARRYPVEDITDLYRIQVGDRIIDTAQPRVDAKGKLRAHPAYKGVKKLATGHHHHLVQFIGPIKEQWLAEIKKAGGQPRVPHGAFTYVVRADDKSLAKINALSFVRWVGHLSHRDRIEPSVLPGRGSKADAAPEPLPRTKILPGLYSVEFFTANDLKNALADIKKIGFDIMDQDKKAAIAVIEDPEGGAGAAKRLRELSAIHGVRYIRKRAFKRTSNDVAAQIMGTRAALSTTDLGLSGKGEVIAVCDTGLDNADPQTIHPDFAGRIKAIMSYPITRDFAAYVNNPGGDDGAADFDSGHGTHVAGSVLGNGATSLQLPGNPNPIRGLAYRAHLVFQAIEQEMKWKNPDHYRRYGRYLLSGIPLDLTRLFADAYEQKARIHSNSWGGGQPGEYDSQSEQLDRFVWEHKDFCVLVACGNDGTDQDGDGKINPMSVTSPATGKNCITVGACENERSTFNTNTYGGWWPTDYPVAPYRSDPMADNADQVVAFSSRGPTRDGRIKPEVVAPGTFILSTRSTMIAPNNTSWSAYPPSRLYFYMGGTSMATPLTAGAVGLIREYLRTRMAIKAPSAALLKATLIAGARRLPGYGAPAAVVDNDQGYGRVNLDAVLAPSAMTERAFVEITPGLRTGEVYTTTINIKSAQVPLRVVMAYSDFPGPSLVNNLNLILVAPDGKRHVGNQTPGASLSMDVNNNVEVVHISAPEPGNWTLQVVGSNIPHGPQEFALVYLAHLSGASETQEVFEEEAPDLAIPDDDAAGISSTITVSQPGIIGSIKVGVDITHTYIGDLRVALTAPDNTTIVLHNRTGASTNDLVQTYDARSTPDLAHLSGRSASGDWKLTVSDHAGIDVGNLRRWNLAIQLASARQIEQDRQPAVAIPDNDPAGVVDSMAIAVSGNIKDAQVWVDITHTWVGDLRVKLLPPAGKEIILHDRSGRGQDNLIKTYSAENLAAMNALVGQPAQGTWTLGVTDLAGRDVGKLNRWGLKLTL
ncbi:MAG: S8 family serine peptidase [Deltaproteobacteria bacterium]|jgi:subtilisin-like proprotein convertase family protein|nr:S8 family serine peptidase [Deltaproteobacteria bacterium]